MLEDRVQQLFDYKDIVELKARFGRLAGIVQSDAVDVRVARVSGIALDRQSQPHNRVVVAFRAHQLQAERMLQGRTPHRRHHAEPIAQHLLALGIAPDGTQQVRQVDVPGRELRLQCNRRPIRSLGDVSAAQASLERAEGDLGFRALGVGGL